MRRWWDNYHIVNKAKGWEDAKELTEDMLIDWACGDWRNSIIISRKWVVVDFGYMTCQWEGCDAVRRWRRRVKGMDEAWNKSIVKWKLAGGCYEGKATASGEVEKPGSVDEMVRMWGGEYYFGDVELDEAVSQEPVQVLDRKGLLLPEFVELVAHVSGLPVYANGNELLFVGGNRHVVDDAMARFIGNIKYRILGK